MDYDQLHLKTVELLAGVAANYGLPSTEEHNDEECAFCDGDTSLASSLATALRECKDKELPLAERQEASEVVALRSNIQRLRNLKERMNSCNDNMSELKSAYNNVTARTSSLHDACDRALAHQTALAAGAEQIKNNLHFFKQADIIMKKLNNTTKLSVTGQTFTGILASIDECLSFLKQHPEYKESALYISKYEQCLSRAMTWIRVGVLADLEASVDDVRERQAQLQVDYDKLGRLGADDDTFALLYGVFASRANSVKSALAVAEQRFAKVPEFQEMLSECQNAYFLTRQQLLTPIIQSTLSHLTALHGESSCALTRTGCSFVLRVCDDEFRLYRQFFSTDCGDPSSPRRNGRLSPTGSMFSQAVQLTTVHPFEEFTETLSRVLYDMLRPIVVHNPHLETLAELCAILKVEMIEERCSLMATIVGDESSSFDPRAGFVHVMGELVGDVAERIVYRAESYAVTDIGGYRPGPGDLAYPDKLEMMRNIEMSKVAEVTNVTSDNVDDPLTAEGIEERVARKDSSSTRQAPTSAVDLHCLWYPTVRRTVMCLAKLFKCLDMGVFQSLARELLIKCCESLDFAASQIAIMPAKKTGSTKALDAQLFVVKHLLILREQTTPYRQAASNRADANLPTKDFSIDFTKMRNSFMEGSRWLEFNSNNVFLELLFSVPIHMSEQSGDSRLVIDSRVRSSCNHLIITSTNIVLGQLLQWVDRAEDELLNSDFDLPKHPDLAPGLLKDLAHAGYKALSTAWPDLKAKYSLYIGVPETEMILLSPVKKRIADTFARASAFASRAYDEEGISIAALPNIQQVYLMLSNE